MSKHLKNLDTYLASIDGSLAAVAKVCILLVESGLLEKLVVALDNVLLADSAAGLQKRPVSSSVPKEPEATATSSNVVDPAPEKPVADRFCVTQEGIKAGKWITCKVAWGRLGMVKSTLDARLNAGVLTRYHKKGDEHLKKPRFWLSREEVEGYYRDYTLMKGKEK